MSFSLPEWVRVVIISGVALMGDVATLLLLTHVATVHYLASAVVAFFVGMVINYELSIHWAFSQRRYADTRKELVFFAGIGILGAGINELLLWLGAGVLGWPLLAAKTLSVGLVFFWNYGLRKAFLFS